MDCTQFVDDTQPLVTEVELLGHLLKAHLVVPRLRPVDADKVPFGLQDEIVLGMEGRLQGLQCRLLALHSVRAGHQPLVLHDRSLNRLGGGYGQPAPRALPGRVVAGRESNAAL